VKVRLGVLFSLGIAVALAATVFAAYSIEIAAAIFSKIDGYHDYGEALKSRRGVEIRLHKAGRIPTSINVEAYMGRNISLTTSMGDSSIKITDVDTGESAEYRLPVNSKPRVGVLCDTDNDSVPEIIVPLWGEGHSSIFIARINGELEIEPLRYLSVGYRPRVAICADLDSDGFVEILTADNYSDTITIISNNGGTLAGRKTVLTGHEPGAIAVADFDRDGTLEIVVSNRASNNIQILKRKLNQEYELVLTLPATAAPKDQGVADFNNDGYLDVVSVDGGSGIISIYYMRFLELIDIKRINSNGSPHAVAIFADEKTANNVRVAIATYPNWVEVIDFCEGTAQPLVPHWFGYYLKRKILYLDYHSKKSSRLFVTMAGIDKFAEVKLSVSSCAQSQRRS
jgi:hypothetical protein